MADVNDLEPYLETFDSATGYLDWAAFGPLSPAVRAEMLADAELLGSGRRSSIDLVTARVTEARDLVAGVLGCAPEEVVLQPSTTHGLFHAMQGLTGTVVVSAQDFPSLRVTARRAQDARGLLSVREIDPIDGIVTVDAVAEALDDDVTAVGVSLVDFRTGALADLAALRELIGDRLLIVDAIQGFGVTEVDWAAADVVCANGYKWLRAGRGTGFARFSDRARERIEPVLSGISGMQGDATTPGVPAPLATAAAYQVAPTDPLAAGRLAAALREMTDAGIPAIAQELRARARDVMDLADRYAVPVLTPRDRHAGIVTLQPAAHDAAALAAALANHGVTVTARGATIRVSPHVGTGADSLRLLGDALAEVAATRVVIDAAPGALALSEADIVPAPPALADAVGSDTAN
ncbi:aminotransferase class V-fold PLP-dependent enzyme [Microbacterium hominis]|uniref:aminotransferase class V-fold PLP-dependent enzyme n=1 Tax=Microbacterium hominis TaxID=162426 RepID=UPI00077C8A11|nr:aminotransferase class V-fold PLP-dependent enzyme [Microbacterium hominis]